MHAFADPLNLFAPSGSSRTLAGKVFLYVKEIDEARRAEIDVKCAERDVERIERSAGYADPADTVGSIVDVVDKIVKCIDDNLKHVSLRLHLVWIGTWYLFAGSPIPWYRMDSNHCFVHGSLIRVLVN